MSTVENMTNRIKSRVSNVRNNIAGKMGVKKQNDVHILNGQLIEKGKQLLSEFRSRDKPMKKLSLTTGERMGMDFGDGRSPKAVVQNKILDIMT